MIRLLVLLLSLAPCAPLWADWTLEEMVARDGRGRPVYRAKPLPAELANPVSEREEEAFQARARGVIAEQSKRKVPAGNTYFENEKRTYGYLMAQALGERGLEAVKDLQVEDAQAKDWHRETAGIDFYAAFTLKHQMRKYFYFGDLLEPEYRKRMFEGARAWTAQDPLRRPHHAYRGGPGWGPDHKNSWVDVRSTENLYLMRVTSVYLMAEETGNRETAEKYQREIRRYVQSLYRVGMGEWDSENYHGHSIPPLLNLHDFARDREVKLLAKAALDWAFAAGAVKYLQGGFNGPTKRDYNHVQPFGGSAANMLWMHFGGAERPEHAEWESDEVHLVTSAYRPPPAVYALARKELRRPVEIFASKPHYSASTGGDWEAPPEYLETQYLGRTFLLGSLASGTSAGNSDVNGFKILLKSDRRGAGAIQAVPGPDPLFPGSPQYQQGKVSAPNRVAQYRNLAIWLAAEGKSPWLWVLPEEIEVSSKNGVLFLKADHTWLALHPLGTNLPEIDAKLTAEVRERNGKPHWADHRVLSARGAGGGFCGFAVELGEQATHGDFAKFQSQVLAAPRPNVSQLGEGRVEWTASDGRTLALRFAEDPAEFQVWRDGRLHDWQEHARWCYRAAGEDPAAGPIHQAWLGGALTVSAGGRTFSCSVDDDGRVRFVNE